MNTSLPPAKDALLAGTKILDVVLKSFGFEFEFRGEGQGSGGIFAWGEYVRSDRRLELHFRHSLGLVTYHAMAQKASHETYMRELGVWGRNRYPGFSPEPLQGFRDLAHDLNFTSDFTCGDAKILLAAARKEAIVSAAKSEQQMAGYVGDARQVETMQALFRAKRYAEVVALYDSLKFPHLLSDVQLRLVELARKRSNG